MSHALTHGTRSTCTPSSPSCRTLAPRRLITSLTHCEDPLPLQECGSYPELPPPTVSTVSTVFIVFTIFTVLPLLPFLPFLPFRVCVVLGYCIYIFIYIYIYICHFGSRSILFVLVIAWESLLFWESQNGFDI